MFDFIRFLSFIGYWVVWTRKQITIPEAPILIFKAVRVIMPSEVVVKRYLNSDNLNLKRNVR